MTYRRFRTLGLVAAATGVGCLLLLFAAGAGEDPRSAWSRPAVERPAFADTVTPTSSDRGSYEDLRDRRRVALPDFTLADKTVVTLELEQFDVFTRDVTLVAGGSLGEVPMERPRVALFRGQVSGETASHVFLSVSPYGVYGVVAVDDATHVVSSGPLGSACVTVVYDLATLPVDVIDWTGLSCRSDELDSPRPEFVPAPGAAEYDARGVRSGPCRVSQIALESDWEFTGNLFGGDTGASRALSIQS